MEPLSNLPEPGAPKLSRRTVVAGIAWSVPVIAVATATPAFAASPGIGPITVLPTTFSKSGGTLTQAGGTGFLPANGSSGHAAFDYIPGTAPAGSFTSGSDTNGSAATITAQYTFNAIKGATYSIALTVTTQNGTPSGQSERQRLSAIVTQPGATSGSIVTMTIPHTNTQRTSDSRLPSGYKFQAAGTTQTYTLTSWKAAQAGAVTIQCTFTLDQRRWSNSVSDDIRVSPPVVNRIS